MKKRNRTYDAKTIELDIAADESHDKRGAMQWASRQEKISPAERMVLLGLIAFMNEDGYCWPSRADLMKKTGVGDPARAIRALKEAGLVTEAFPGAKGSGAAILKVEAQI